MRPHWLGLLLLCACKHEPGEVDLGEPVEDFAVSDLAAVDSASDDLGGDMAGAPDMAMPPVDRYVFLLPQTTPLFASATAADDACAQAALGASLGPAGAAWHALLQFRDPAPTTHDRNPLTGVDRVILPSGTVVSTGSGFWGTHMAEIDELADMSKLGSVCVWTGFNASGDRLSANTGDCGEWTSTSTGDDGYAGITHSFNPSGLAWAYGAVQTCDISCYVYCLQQ